MELTSTSQMTSASKKLKQEPLEIFSLFLIIPTQTLGICLTNQYCLWQEKYLQPPQGLRPSHCLFSPKILRVNRIIPHPNSRPQRNAFLRLPALRLTPASSSPNPSFRRRESPASHCSQPSHSQALQTTTAPASRLGASLLLRKQFATSHRSFPKDLAGEKNQELHSMREKAGKDRQTSALISKQHPACSHSIDLKPPSGLRAIFKGKHGKLRILTRSC